MTIFDTLPFLPVLGLLAIQCVLIILGGVVGYYIGFVVAYLLNKAIG